jgi:hypothetical protein
MLLHYSGWVKRSNIRDFAKFQATLRKKSKKPDFVAAVKEAEEWDPNEVSAEEEAERDSGSQSLRSPSPKRRNDDKALVLTSDDEEEKDAEFVPEPSVHINWNLFIFTFIITKTAVVFIVSPSQNGKFQN